MIIHSLGYHFIVTLVVVVFFFVVVVAYLQDGIFDFMDTYEEKALKLKVAKHDGELEKKRLEKELEKVCSFVNNLRKFGIYSPTIYDT